MALYINSSSPPLGTLPSMDPLDPQWLIHNTSVENTTHSSYSPPAYGMSCLSMGLGVISNITGLMVLAGSHGNRLRRRAKAPFVMLAGTLLLTDLAGQVIPGTFALYLHLEKRYKPPDPTVGYLEPTWAFCKLFGACMVFFGLCPLLLGSAMAAERCLGITQPFLHAAIATVMHVRIGALLLVALALTLAALPTLGLGSYEPQYPGTWCFLPVQGQLSSGHVALALIFSSLGLLSLLLSVLCNTMSGAVLLQTRRRSHSARDNAGKHRGRDGLPVGLRSLEVEMMAQLAVINIVSCVCWCPFLICISLSVGQLLSGSSSLYPVRKQEQQLLLSLRLASWNQILDPWVYILLRRAVLRRLCYPLWPQKFSFRAGSSSSGSHKQDVFSLK